MSIAVHRSKTNSTIILHGLDVNKNASLLNSLFERMFLLYYAENRHDTFAVLSEWLIYIHEPATTGPNCVARKQDRAGISGGIERLL
jgi:hypothetical protein